MEINVSKYLNEEQMAKIAEEVYREKVAADIDRLFGDRNLGIPDLVARVLDHIAKETIERYGKDCEVDLRKVIRTEIERTDPLYEYQTLFRSYIGDKIRKEGARWIDEHPTEMQDAVGKYIIAYLNELVLKRLPSLLEERIDLPGLIDSLLKKE